MANSSVTITLSKIDSPYAENRGIVKAKIDWVADDTNGSVPQTDFSATQVLDILGRYCILGVVDPGAVAPQAAYDIELLDEHGADVFGAELNNLDAALSSQAMPKMGNHYGPRVCAGTWTFKLTNNNVNSAVGTCVLYFRA